MTRWIGTPGHDAAEAYTNIPADGEVRDHDRVLVVGAGGPMGQMQVIRIVCLGKHGLQVVGTDFEDARLESLLRKAEPMARVNDVALRLINPQRTPLDEAFTYFVLMAPVGALVASAIQQADDGAIINIFAGIPAPVRHDLDLDRYIEKRCFLFGTSGSTIEDMRIVLRKVEGINWTPTLRSMRSAAWRAPSKASLPSRTAPWPARSSSIPCCTKSA
jgi:L-sorbose 1-phosphate reductase